MYNLQVYDILADIYNLNPCPVQRPTSPIGVTRGVFVLAERDR
jgi:hypothetical protein